MAFYPHGSIEWLGGDLVSVESFSLDIDNKAAVETTMHTAGAGFSFGPVTVSGDFMIKNSTVAERNFLGAVMNKTINSITLKTSDGTRLPITCAFGKIGLKDQEAGASTSTINYMGTIPKSAAQGAGLPA